MALSPELTGKLNNCKAPDELPPEWLACKDGDEACRRARDLPVHVENGRRHYVCAALVDEVKSEAARAKAQNP